MSINEKKSCCIRIGPRSDLKCASIATSNGHNLPWVNEVRYLGTYSHRHFKCSVTQAKKSFHRSINAIFGKVGRIASEEVILHLVKTKCFPILLYGLECYPLNKADTRSLDFAVTRFLMKMFRTVNMDVINECRFYFDFMLPSELLVKRAAFRKFNSSSIVCHFGFTKCVKCV